MRCVQPNGRSAQVLLSAASGGTAARLDATFCDYCCSPFTLAEPPFGAAGERELPAVVAVHNGVFGMIASYSDHVECERLGAALVADSACLARLAASQPGVDREKLLAGVAQLIRQWA